jgi:hypothetical protein
MRQADAAIVARLVEVIPRNRFRADFRYRVRHVYRGAQMIDRGETISVRSARDSAACGLPNQQDRAVGLLLHREDRRWTAGLCSVIDPDQLWAAARHAYVGVPRRPSPDCAS